MIRATSDGRRATKRGFTLLELLIAMVLFAVLAAVTVYVFTAILKNFSSSETRAGINVPLDRAVEEMARELREATQIKSTANYDEIRFTPDGTNYYIYYLYHEDDAYGPPPAFDQASYQLMREGLTGDIDGTFTYGDGRIIINDVIPPTATDISASGNVITIDISVKRKDETIRARTEIRPRNL